MSTTADVATGGKPQNVTTVFIGLMLGMLLAAVSQTIISPAMPRIVAELGGIEHYSWIAVSTLLASTVIVPIVGKLSDLFGRKAFYVAGILVFLASSVIAAMARDFNTFIVARVVEGLGMGTMMPLSQAIIGDLIPPRERGKYQGYMGGVFGLASVIGPLVGGWITEHLDWRWLFWVNLPVGLVALGFIVPFMRIPHQRRPHRIDYAGFVTLSVGLTATLLATTWGGSSFPWASPQIVGLYALGAASLGLFVWAESRAAEPVIPLRLWRSGIFTFSNLAILCIAMAMFGSIYFIPVFVQGVIGAGVAQSGAVLTPMMLSLVVMSAVNGQIVSRTGRYKVPVLVGIALVGAGFFLLTQMDRQTGYGAIVRNMVLIGAGLGMAMQTYVIIVQNAVGREDLGVATATTQLFRSVGSSVGVAVLGTLMTQGMAREAAAHLPPEALARMGAEMAGGEGLNAGAILDPAILARLPPAAVEGLRDALAAALHPVFVAGLPFVGLAFLLTLLVREIPLRRTTGPGAGEAGREVLTELAQAGEGDDEPVLGAPNPAYRGRAGFLGLVYAFLAEEAEREGRETLREVVGRLGGGDLAEGRARLGRVGGALMRECGDGTGAAAPPPTGARPAGIAQAGCLAGLDPVREFERALADRPPELRTHLRQLVESAGRRSEPALTPDDLEALERIGVAAAAALLLDLAARRSGEAHSGAG
ncbi:MAG TPA: MDR family MFS transporter [Longimicrobiaceae bacterium]|jgi:EmrB/QacA subfamily drug resistance transporter